MCIWTLLQLGCFVISLGSTLYLHTTCFSGCLNLFSCFTCFIIICFCEVTASLSSFRSSRIIHSDKCDVSICSLYWWQSMHRHHSGCLVTLPQCLYHFDVDPGQCLSYCTTYILLIPLSTRIDWLINSQSLLTDPNPASPANPEAAQWFQHDNQAYNKLV